MRSSNDYALHSICPQLYFVSVDFPKTCVVDMMPLTPIHGAQTEAVSPLLEVQASVNKEQLRLDYLDQGQSFLVTSHGDHTATFTALLHHLASNNLCLVCRMYSLVNLSARILTLNGKKFSF